MKGGACGTVDFTAGEADCGVSLYKEVAAAGEDAFEEDPPPPRPPPPQGGGNFWKVVDLDVYSVLYPRRTYQDKTGLTLDLCGLYQKELACTG